MYADLKLLNQLEDKVKINWVLAEMEDPFYDDVFAEYKKGIDEQYEAEAAKPLEVENVKEYFPEIKRRLKGPEGHFGPIVERSNDTKYLELEPPKQ